MKPVSTRGIGFIWVRIGIYWRAHVNKALNLGFYKPKSYLLLNKTIIRHTILYCQKYGINKKNLHLPDDMIKKNMAH